MAMHFCVFCFILCVHLSPASSQLTSILTSALSFLANAVLLKVLYLFSVDIIILSLSSKRPYLNVL